MTVVSKPIIANAYSSLSITDINTKNFAKKPPSGGIPANEKNKIKNDKANRGFCFESPDKSSIFSVYFPSTFIRYKQAKVPIFIIT